MTDPTYSHDAQQAFQDALEHVAQSIVDAADVKALFDAARVRYTSITPQSDGAIRVASDVDFSTSALNRLYAAMGASENWNGGAFTVRHHADGKGGYAWVLTRRTG